MKKVTSKAEPPSVTEQSESGLPMKLAQPAQRALAASGIQRLEQLTRFTEKEVKQWHGIEPNALAQLRQAIANKGLSIAKKMEN